MPKIENNWDNELIMFGEVISAQRNVKGNLEYSSIMLRK